jgi:signal transduction histidine kinase
LAADGERRRLEQRLQATAELRLTRLRPELERARVVVDGDPQRAARLQRVSEQLEHSLADVRRLAAGLHPRELATGGLTRAVQALAARSPVPVELRVELPEQLPAEVERAAYFVCSEGLANVAKYADAARARVTIAPVAARLRVEVADDGRGGADLGGGTGLRGLADRVEALGGALTVDSRPGAGTRLVAEFPATGPT